MNGPGPGFTMVKDYAQVDRVFEQDGGGSKIKVHYVSPHNDGRWVARSVTVINEQGEGTALFGRRVLARPESVLPLGLPTAVAIVVLAGRPGQSVTCRCSNDLHEQ